MTPTDKPLRDPRKNQLLAALPESEWNRWRPYLQPAELSAGQVLCEAGSTPAHVYFPTSAVISLLQLTREGASSEIAVVGNDGMVGISLFMGGDATPTRATVQGAGQSWRLPALAVRSEVQRGGPVLTILLRYTQALIAQVSQTAACNRHHAIDQQVCRRLLVGMDRSSSNELMMTQEGVASLLGVRREGVTAAALKLQEAGVIRYSRGRITVLDREGLEERACECYGATRKVHEALLPTALAA